MIICQCHNIDPQLFKNKGQRRCRPESKLLILCRRSPGTERKFLICHENIRLIDHRLKLAVQYAADASVFIGIHHMI